MALVREDGGGLEPQQPLSTAARSRYASPLPVRGPVDIHPIQPTSAATARTGTAANRIARSAAQPVSATRLPARLNEATAAPRILDTTAFALWSAAAAEPTAASSHSAPPAASTPTRYYTYRDNVPLKAGQTVGYTPGKGYYAKGTGTGPAIIQQISDAASGRGYTPTRPKPKPGAKTPAGPTVTGSRGGGSSNTGRGGQDSDRTESSAKRPKKRKTRTIAGVAHPPAVLVKALRSLERSAVRKFEKDSGLHLNKAEFDYYARDSDVLRTLDTLNLAYSIVQLERIAAGKPYRLWGNNPSLTEGVPDAFLHAVTAGLLTLRFGAAYAKKVTDLHEAGTLPSKGAFYKNARTMDLHNNAVGINFALTLKQNPPPASLSFSEYRAGIAKNNTEAELIWALLAATVPKKPGNRSAIDLNLVTLSRPGATSHEIKRDPRIYSIYSGKPVKHIH